MIFFLSNLRKEVRMIIFMCSEVESSGLKAITVYCGSMYSMFACQASILHFAKIYRAECFVQRVPSSPLKLLIAYKIHGEEKS